jgi:hypothetical protein
VSTKSIQAFHSSEVIEPLTGFILLRLLRKTIDFSVIETSSKKPRVCAWYINLSSFFPNSSNVESFDTLAELQAKTIKVRQVISSFMDIL